MGIEGIPSAIWKNPVQGFDTPDATATGIAFFIPNSVYERTR